MLQKARILIVDDDTATAHALGDSLGHDGYLCELARSGASALETVARVPCDVVICDVKNGGMHDMELLDRLKKLHPALPVIIVTANSAVGEAVDAMKHGAFQYLPKPYDLAALRGFVLQATDGRDRWNPSTAALDLGESNGELVQRSPAMRALVQSITLVAHSNAPVLVLGESGTGKERVARAIHARGARGNRPFVAVNAAAIPEQLLESEVFGHVRGAFTGATQARKGLLVEADGGTLLLDEIGDMPLALQPKLLRVLQFGEVRPVGSDRTRHVDVRVIAATHRDLGTLVGEGRFRDDLRYRLNVIPLLVPPLRHRKEDIPPLASHFLEKARERTAESPVRSISVAAMRTLTEASWFGNVRELESTMERLVVLGRDTMIMPRDLSFLEPAPAEQPLHGPKHELWTLKEMNMDYLARVLLQTGGDKVRAAEILDVDISTLYRWQRAKS